MRDIGEILRDARTIAVLGMSDSPLRESNRIGLMLREVGYSVYPVNPTIESVEDMKSWPTPADVPVPIDILNVFRNSSHAEEVVDAAIEAKVPLIWFQLETATRQAIERARGAGIEVIAHHCIAVEVRLRAISIG